MTETFIALMRLQNILGELQKTVRLCHVHSRKEIEKGAALSDFGIFWV